MSVAKLLEKRTHQVEGKSLVSEFSFEVPLNHDPGSSRGGTLKLFARSIARNEKPVDPTKAETKQLPWLLYLQGGPGIGCKSPQNYRWTEKILDKGYQILFLDQRGTGLSSTVTERMLTGRYSSEAQANYLRLFRADSIVEDCEAIRKTLTSDYPEEKKKWSIIGQSFGGFSCMTYLSFHPEALQEGMAPLLKRPVSDSILTARVAFICGGLAPLVNQPDPVYRKLYLKVAERNHAFYQKYPEDVQRVKNIVHYLETRAVELPSGGTLSIPRFRQLGINFGFHGAIDAVHDLILRMASDLDYFAYFTRPTLAEYENLQSFDTLPLYALVHELIYLQGANTSDWSAHRMMQERPEFMNLSTSNAEPVYFTGEMIYPTTFSSSSELRSLCETANILAQMSDWPALYDEIQLATNEVHVYASIYVDDMYVSFDSAMETAKKIGNCKYFVTNTMYHNAIGVAGRSDELMKELFKLRDDCMD